MYQALSPQQFNYHHRLIDRAPTSTLQTAFTDVTGQIFGTSKVAEDDVVGKAFHRDGSRKMKQVRLPDSVLQLLLNSIRAVSRGYLAGIFRNFWEHTGSWAFRVTKKNHPG